MACFHSRDYLYAATSDEMFCQAWIRSEYLDVRRIFPRRIFSCVSQNNPPMAKCIKKFATRKFATQKLTQASKHNSRGQQFFCPHNIFAISGIFPKIC
ncbi:hypothetical protein XENTR_v10007248 [Xenopus tropicalis]|nr:hypothetical protein XENTR_v10007248 [Xenopus tropicalis]